MPSSSSIEDLPEALLSEILDRLPTAADRNSASLACRRIHAVDSRHRASLKVGCGLHPAANALASLCHRFPNLRRLDIDYSGWMYRFGEQLDDYGLLVLSTFCPSLSDLSLSFCTFVSDVGVAHLSNCARLSSLKLNFVPAVGSNGLLSITFGCKSLRRLHVSRCTKINSADWLESLGRVGRLDDLSIRNCRAIGEGDLAKLGSGWSTLRYFEFELDVNYRESKVYTNSSSAASGWKEHRFPCERLKELRLSNCFTAPTRAFSCLMGRCGGLERLSLDMCIGLRDTDLILLAQNSKGLRSISLRLPSNYVPHNPTDGSLLLTDESLNALARGCSSLEEVSISFPRGDFTSLCCFSQDGVVALVRSCPVRVLVLDHAHFFNDGGVEALCSASCLEDLQFVQCQEVTDEGLKFVMHFPRLAKLSLCKCLGVTDDGLQPLVDSRRLELLTIRDCPQISEEGARGAARSVSYTQDLSWLY